MHPDPFLADLKLAQLFILHYLDDFMVLGVDREGVDDLTKEVVEMLQDKGFLVSPKSKSEPTQDLTWPGKSFDLVKGHVGNTDRGMLVGLAKWLVLATGYCNSKGIQSAVGKFRWLARPHEYISHIPTIGGAVCTFHLGSGFPIPNTHYFVAFFSFRLCPRSDGVAPGA